MQHHNYSLSEIDGLIPWEREVYVKLLEVHLAKQKQRAEKNGNTG